MSKILTLVVRSVRSLLLRFYRPLGAVSLALCAVLCCHAAPARADLLGDVESLAEGWRRSGALVETVATTFMSNGESRVLRVLSKTSSERPCLTVLALGERGVSFAIAWQRHSQSPPAPHARGREHDGPADGDDGRPEASESRDSRAGVAMITRCARPVGEGEDDERVVVSFSSTRGAVEVVAAIHAPGLASVDDILPARAIGPVAPLADIGSPLEVAPVEQRIRRAQAAAKRDGAEVIVPITARAADDGSGALVLKLSAGCHRLGVLADGSAAGDAPIDVDAEVREPASDEPLRSDRSHAPDARLDFCLGEARRLELRWVGAGPQRPMHILDAYWAAPPGIPARWGLEERSGMLWALFKRQAPIVNAMPDAEWIGASGTTLVPLTVERGACYLAALAVSQGHAAAMRLSVSIAGQTHHDDGVDRPRGAAVTFCAASDGVLRSVVDVRGKSLEWRMALWRLGGFP